MEKKEKIIFILAAILIFAVALVVIFGVFNGKKTASLPYEETQQPGGLAETENVNPTPASPNDATSTEKIMTAEEAALVQVLKESKIEVTGANPITKDGKVINKEGDQTRTDVAPTDSLAPVMTRYIEETDIKTENTINIEMSLGSIKPNIFSVKAGEAITIVVNAKDAKYHILAFREEALKNVRIAPLPGGMAAMTFQAPTVRGTYNFYCAVGGESTGHQARGEAGKMIVE